MFNLFKKKENNNYSTPDELIDAINEIPNKNYNEFYESKLIAHLIIKHEKISWITEQTISKITDLSYQTATNWIMNWEQNYKKLLVETIQQINLNEYNFSNTTQTSLELSVMLYCAITTCELYRLQESMMTKWDWSTYNWSNPLKESDKNLQWP